MLGHLVEGDVVEVTGFELAAVEDALPDIEAIALGDGLDIAVSLHADRLAAAILVIGQGSADAAADIQHPHIARHPAEGRAALAIRPGPETLPLLFGLEIVQVEISARIILGIEPPQIV